VNNEEEGVSSPQLEVRSKGHVVLTADFEWGRICRIFVMDPRFHTARGISVGSTYADVKKAYPGLEVGTGEGVQCAIAEAESLSFCLDTYTIEPPPDSSRVTAIVARRSGDKSW
jgi:hypothetical protein